MIGVSISQASVDAVKKALGNLSHRYAREIKTAINETAKQVRIQASRALKTELKVPSRILKRTTYTKSKASADNLRAIIGLFEGYPIPLKYFGAKQTKKGVTYKINPKLKRRSILGDAFIIRNGGNVYRRVGPERKPLQLIYGPKPGDAYEKLGIAAMAVAVATEELPKQINRRIRFLNLKASGGLRGKQK